ncbi:alcohol dehydrogenase [Mycena capillaripes]|nr:alcohol dehydrogenase [Mycena capillaripes]
MPPVTNARVLFAAVPKDFPIPGETTVYDTSQTIDLEDVPLNGGFLMKTLVLSVDPYFRGRMRHPEQKSYSPPFTLGDPLIGFGVAIVLRSDNSDVVVGKYVYGVIPHQQYNIIPNMEGLIFLQKDPILPWTVYVGAAGMPGKTAYMGWKEFSRAKKGETAFITTGAGPVGSMVIQLAKRDGLKVIASAGSDEKVKFMKEIGADVAFNYKTTDTREVLAREGPIDVYWDNVGGDILDAALEHANVYGRFLECGMISGNRIAYTAKWRAHGIHDLSGYNTGQKGIKNLNQTYAKSLTISSVLVFRLQPKYDEEFYRTVPSQLASAELKYSEEVSRGLETVGDVILRVQQGRNTAKAVVVVADE